MGSAGMLSAFLGILPQSLCLLKEVGSLMLHAA